MPHQRPLGNVAGALPGLPLLERGPSDWSAPENP
jgi:hypothetical protein